MATSERTAQRLLLSVHGQHGVLDLVVPPGATAADVAREYLDQTGAGKRAELPVLHRRLGAALAPERSLAEAGVRSGEVLVAAGAADLVAPARRAGPATPAVEPGPRRPDPRVLVCLVASVAALLAGWAAAGAGPGPDRNAAVAVLGLAALLGVLPLGAAARHRVLAAPAFAAAAALAVVLEPGAERLPMTLGVAALAAAVAAAVGRALTGEPEQALRVWMIAGGAVFVLTALAALADQPPRVSWALLLVLATLMARFVPALAVDVPDHYLLDLDRLAVTAWSAREQPRRRRGRTVVHHEAVAEIVRRGAALVDAAAAAVLVVVAVSAPLLLATATLPLDRIGARVLVGLCGAALLLAARSYRHVVARALLRLAGLSAWAALAAVGLVGLSGLSAGRVTALGLGAVGVASLLVVAAVATGRGWRSAWWSRRAEVAESVVGAFAIAAVLVATGVFRSLWEMTS